MTGKKPISLVCLLWVAGIVASSALMALGMAIDVVASDSWCWSPYVVQCAPHQSVKQSVCRAGDGPNDLQIHIVGPHKDAVEVYFRNEFFRYTFPDTDHLKCNIEVVLAPKNELGTFAVIYGKNRDRFMAFGWKKGKNVPDKTQEIVLDSPIPVVAKWVSTQILKIEYGKRLQNAYILRFNDADQAWNVFFQTDNPDRPFDPSPTTK